MAVHGPVMAHALQGSGPVARPWPAPARWVVWFAAAAAVVKSAVGQRRRRSNDLWMSQAWLDECERRSSRHPEGA